MAYFTAPLSSRTTTGEFRSSMKKQMSKEVRMIHPHDLAKDLHSLVESFLLLDCRPILAYNSCHITGAININFTGMTKRRFMAGKMALTDLVTTEEGREKFKNHSDWPAVVYDECSADLQNLASSNSLRLVLLALEDLGMVSYVLQGGLSEFNVLHPSLCVISLPCIRQTLTPAALRATTPGVRDQPLDWQTAPPVHVLSYLVLGGKKDAMSKEVFKDFKIRFVLNVTPGCPNYFEDDTDVTYKRIAVTDTGSQKLSDKFQEAFDFIEKACNTNSIILIHCMAGVSRSVTLTIAYLMSYFGLTMQSAYQLVKDKRPAISPNLNFMGQLVSLEHELKERRDWELKDVSNFLPSDEQEHLTDLFQQESFNIIGGPNEDTPSPKAKLSPGSTPGSGSGSGSGTGKTSSFVLKLPIGRNRKAKKMAAVASGSATSPEAMNLKNSPTPRDETDHPLSLGDTPTPTPKTEPKLEVPKKESESGDDSDKTPVAPTAKEFPKPSSDSTTKA